jgi:hypothetical protein
MCHLVRHLPQLEQHRTNADPGVVTTKRVPVVMDEAAAPIEETLERNGKDLDSILWNTGDRWPWAWVFFPECYPLAGHVRAIRADPSGMPFSPYERPPDPIPPGWNPCVGAVMPMTKEILEDAAQHSPMFESAWAVLANRAADTSWVCLSDPLDAKWVKSVRDSIQGDQ